MTWEDKYEALYGHPPSVIVKANRKKAQQKNFWLTRAQMKGHPVQPPDPPGCLFCKKQEPDCKCWDTLEVEPKSGATVLPGTPTIPVCSCTMAELLMFGKLDNQGNCSLCGGR